LRAWYQQEDEKPLKALASQQVTDKDNEGDSNEDN